MLADLGKTLTLGTWRIWTKLVLGRPWRIWTKLALERLWLIWTKLAFERPWRIWTKLALGGFGKNPQKQKNNVSTIMQFTEPMKKKALSLYKKNLLRAASCWNEKCWKIFGRKRKR
jgi:hypothetical protein